jgi:environmental stress-induced protein Ves
VSWLGRGETSEIAVFPTAGRFISSRLSVPDTRVPGTQRFRGHHTYLRRIKYGSMVSPELPK